MGNKQSASTGPLGEWEKEGENDAANGVSPILRNILSVNKAPTTAMPTGEDTMWAMADSAFKKYGKRQAVGKRILEKREMVPSPDGKKQFEKLTLSKDYQWLTYEQLGDRVAKLASSLVKETGLKKGDRMLIFAETQRDWLVAMLAAFRQGATIVTAYATLGEEGVTTSLNQSGASICVCDAKLFKVVENSSKDCPGLKYVVTIPTKADPITEEEMQKALGENIHVKTTDHLVSECKTEDIVEATPATAQDLAVIMYTSGTTGASKGVMLTHENIVSQASSSLEVMPFVTPETVYLGYLPLAHIMELYIECCMLYIGASIGYGTPQTLTDSGVKLAAGQQGDAPLLKPTLMVFAPAVLDKVYAGVKDKVSRAGGLTERMFNMALDAGYRNYDAGLVGCGPAGNALMFKAVQSLVGGRVTNIVAGSAPLSAEIQKFAQSCFNCPVRQGYGLTETCAASCVADMGDNTLGQVGPPTPNTFIRIRDWPEGNYMNSDKDKEGINMRRGEVLIGGPTVASGYLVDEANPDPEVQKKNEEDFITIDGVRYFCTGDVAQINSRGCIMIVDRKKDLFKGDNGEYVSLSKVEALLKLSPHVEIPMVYGKTGAKTVIALICPKKFAIEAIAKEKGVTGSFDEMCKHKDVIAEVAKSCLKECKTGGLNGFEIPSAVALCCTPTGEPAWTPENEMMTSTMKLKRPIIAKAFAAEIDDAYARSA